MMDHGWMGILTNSDSFLFKFLYIVDFPNLDNHFYPNLSIGFSKQFSHRDQIA